MSAAASPAALSAGARSFVPEGRFVDLGERGTTFVREAAGPEGAPTLILLHGLGATGGLNWQHAFGPLSERFRVIAIDHRGHGHGIRSSGRFRLADCADDVVALADALGVERFIPVGYSMGGPIAQLIWHRHRDRVEGLVLCATSRNFRGKPAERLMFWGLGAAVAAMRTPAPSVVIRALHRLVVTAEPDPDLRAWVLFELDGHDPRTVAQAAEAIGRYSSDRWIGDVDVPAAVVAMTEDQLVPFRRQVALARSLPTASLHLVDGDHLVCVRDPATFVTELMTACELVALGAGYAIPTEVAA